MQDNQSSRLFQAETFETQANSSLESTDAIRPMGASFDESTPLSSLKRLQDPAKFDKARFRFRLYRK